MRGCLLLAGFGLVVVGSPAVAQFPQPPAPPIQIPRLPDPPKVAPRPSAADAPASPQNPEMRPPGSPPPAGSFASDAPGLLPANLGADAPLPYPESKFHLDPVAVTVTRADAGWRVGSPGQVLLTTADEGTAREAARVVRDLRPTEWARIGSPRPVVEYGLRDGKPAKAAAFPRQVVPLDLATAKVEQVRGAWVVRDSANIVLNFGPHKADAEQALAVARKHGFNRVGVVGGPPAPALTYFFAAPADEAAPPAANPLAVAAQTEALARTGVPVPGVGFVGEMIRIDPRKVEHRREGADWVLACGPDVLARFGPAEWSARDALRTVQAGGFTEFCTVGPVTFFLARGRAPMRVSLANLGRTFDPNVLVVREYADRWAVVEPTRSGDKPLWDVASRAEGEALVRLAQHYRFDQVCRAGGGGLTFLARSR